MSVGSCQLSVATQSLVQYLNGQLTTDRRTNEEHSNYRRRGFIGFAPGRSFAGNGRGQITVVDDFNEFYDSRRIKKLECRRN